MLDQGRATPEPTLRKTSCNTAIINLTSEFKDVKMEMSQVRQDVQKLQDHTASLEGRHGTTEAEWTLLQRVVKYNHSIATGNAAKLEDIENRLRRNNIRAVGITERAKIRLPSLRNG